MVSSQCLPIKPRALSACSKWKVNEFYEPALLAGVLVVKQSEYSKALKCPDGEEDGERDKGKKINYKTLHLDSKLRDGHTKRPYRPQQDEAVKVPIEHTLHKMRIILKDCAVCHQRVRKVSN